MRTRHTPTAGNAVLPGQVLCHHRPDRLCQSHLFAAPACSPGVLVPYQEVPRNGGRLLVFGPGSDRRDAYDWLPFRVLYTHRKHEGVIEYTSSHACTSLFAGYDPNAIECDGFFPEHDCEVIARTADGAVLIRCSAGSGEAVVTTVHEYPSQAFIRQFCSGTSEILL